MTELTIQLEQRPSEVAMFAGSLGELNTTRRAEREAALFEAGRTQGFAEATQSAAKALEAASDALDELRNGMTESLADSAAQLAVEMLQELLRVELVAQNYSIVNIVRSVVAEAGNSHGAMTLHVHPDDAARLADVPFRTGTTIQADPAVRPGDVELHTSQGQLVRDMDACVASIRERILAEVKSC